MSLENNSEGFIKLEINSSGRTDKGLVREENQDCIFVDQEMGLYIVLDGMGGHLGGGTAARLAREVIVDVVSRGLQHCEPAQLLIEACQTASARVHVEGANNRELHGMGTTVVAVLLTSSQSAIIAHVGDSRAYLMRGKRLTRITNDHTIVAELVAAGRLTPDQAEDHPHASVLSRNLGGLATADVDINLLDLHEGDRLLLCSDGLNGFAAHNTIEQIVSGSPSANSTTQDLIDLAKRGGGGDNISAILIEIGQQQQRSALPDSGARAWWQRRKLFADVCQRMGLSTSPLAAGLEPAEALDLLGNSFCEAVFHDLEKTTGVHVWTYADSLVKAWFAREGGYAPVQELFDILRAASLAVVHDVSKHDENFGVCMEIALLRALIVGEMVVGGELGARIREANEEFVATEKTLELPDSTFANVATVPFAGPSATTPTAPEVKECLHEGLKVAIAKLGAESQSRNHEILLAAHVSASEFSGDGDMSMTAQWLYGNRLLTEQDLNPLLEAMDTCRVTHLIAIDLQDVQPTVRATAYRSIALAHQSLFHAFALMAVDAAKPTTDTLREMNEQTAGMRERMAHNERQIARLEETLGTLDDNE